MRRARRVLLLVSVVLFAGICSCLGQIRGIQSLSSIGGGGGEGAFALARAAVLVFEVAGEGLVNWQTGRLRTRADVPSVISIDVMMQVASNPSIYNILNPRIRGNWGIFLTDFRMNYMLEHAPGGIIGMRTDDWQILGLNIIEQRSLNLRVSTGISYEKFGDNNKFQESVIGGHWRSPGGKIGFMGEYRWSKNYNTGETPRLEVNGSFLRTIASSPRFDLSVTMGAVYQNYYSQIPVWGLQGGLLARLY